MEAEVPRLDSSPFARLVAATLAVIIVVSQAVMFVIWARSGFATPAYIFNRGPLPLLALEVYLVAQTSSGLILVVRLPRNVIGWAVLGFALVSAYAAFAIGYSAGGPATTDDARAWLAWGGSWLAFPWAAFLAIMLAFVFPDGHMISARWRAPLVLAVFGAALTSVAYAVRPGALPLFPSLVNPAVASGSGAASGVGVILGFACLAVGTFFAGAALVVRYQTGGDVGRLQLRWYVASAVVLAGGFAAYLGAVALLPSDSALGELIEIVFFLAVALPPMALVIAILRYRLFDIDVIIGRAFVYGALTAILAGLYAASIRLFNALFVGLTGGSSELELVITTLILATTFTPIKGRLEELVAKRVSDQRPVSAAAQLLDDPLFAAALDAHIRAIVAEGGPGASRTTRGGKALRGDPLATSGRASGHRDGPRGEP